MENQLHKYIVHAVDYSRRFVGWHALAYSEKEAIAVVREYMDILPPDYDTRGEPYYDDFITESEGVVAPPIEQLNGQ